MKRSLVSFGVVIVLGLSVVLGSGLPFSGKDGNMQLGVKDAASNIQASGDTAGHFELNETEQRVMEKIGTVPYITDVLFDQTKDGKLILSAVAEIGTSSDADKKQLARKIAYQFTIAAFQTGIRVAEASIHITDYNQLFLGTSLNEEAYKKMPQSAMTGAGAGEFVQYLQANTAQSTEPGKNTFFYETE